MVIQKESSGMVIFRINNEGNREYLLLRNIGGHWEFPKGGLENEESPIEACIREVQEEAGLKPMKVNDFKTQYSYHFTREGERIEKKVHIFLGKAFRDDVRLSREHRDYDWLSFEQCINRIANSHEELKSVLEEAHNYLEKRKIK